MDTQRPIYEQLVFGPLPLNLALTIFPRRRPEDVFYAVGGYRVKEPNYNLPNAPERYHEHDVIMTMTHFGQIPSGEKKIFGNVTVSIEIKTTFRDLAESSVDKYLGATPFFFVAVPEILLPAAICRYHDHRLRHQIGLIDSDAGQIVVLPQMQSYQQERQDRLIARRSTSIHQIPQYNDTEPFQLHRVPVLPSASAVTVTDFDGLFVNEDYLDLFRREEQTGYSLDRFRI